MMKTLRAALACLLLALLPARAANVETSVVGGNGFAITQSSDGRTYTINSTALFPTVTASCATKTDGTGCTGQAGGDMGNGVLLGGAGATLTLSAKSSNPNMWQPGQTFTVQVSCGATGNWTVTNSSTLTFPTGYTVATLRPCDFITFVADSNGSNLDPYGGTYAQYGTQGLFTSSVANAGTTGTTLNKLTKFTGAPSDGWLPRMRNGVGPRLPPFLGSANRATARLKPMVSTSSSLPSDL